MSTSRSSSSVVPIGHEQKTGPELIDEITQEPTLDRVMDRSPFAHPLEDTEFLELIEFERHERAQFDLKDEKRKMKKEGIEETENA